MRPARYFSIIQLSNSRAFDPNITIITKTRENSISVCIFLRSEKLLPCSFIDKKKHPDIMIKDILERWMPKKRKGKRGRNFGRT